MNSLRMECALAVLAPRGRLDQERMRLLDAIQELGTLGKAAERIGVSYKTAWAWVDALHNAADEPLVEGTHGGSSKGSTRLTAAGRRLLTEYHRMLSAHRRMQEAMEEESTGLDIGAFLARLSFQTSARNQFHGKVQAIRGDRVQAWVDIHVSNDVTLTARTTRASILEMGIVEGVQLAAICKATIVQVDPWGASGSLPGSRSVYRKPNYFPCDILRSHPEETAVEVVLGLGESRTIAALVDPDRWHLVLSANRHKAVAHVNPSDIILVRLT